VKITAGRKISERGKKAVIVLLLAAVCGIFYGATELEEGEYRALKVTHKWSYSYFSKKEQKQKDDIITCINRKLKYEKTEYYDFEVPAKSMQFLVRPESGGIYLKAAKMNILSFIGVDIVFDPPVCFIKFPFVKGETWVYEGSAHVRLLAVLDLEEKLRAEFLQSGPEVIDINGKSAMAYHLSGTVNRRWDTKKPVSGHYWIAMDTGFVKGETENSLVWLKRYETLRTE
jgi:hypothetical protein